MSPFVERLRGIWRSVFILFTIFTDLTAILISSVVALFLRNLIPNLPPVPVPYLFTFTVVFAVVLIFNGTLYGLYRAPFHTDFRHQAFLAAKSYIMSALVILALLYALDYDKFPRRFAAIFLLILPVAFWSGRMLLNRFNRAMQRRGLGLHRVLIAGDLAREGEMFQRFHSFPELGYTIAGIVVKDGRKHNVRSHVRKGSGETLELLDAPTYSMKNIHKVIPERNVDRMFIPSFESFGDDLADLVSICRQHGVKLKLLSKESEDLLRFAYVRDIAGITLYAPQRPVLELVNNTVKRTFDFIVSGISLIRHAPFFVLVAICIVIEDGRPVFFKQKRALVKGGREFDFYKFRSMYKDAEHKQKELYKENEVSGGLFMMKEDPRVTRVGRILRRFSVDELPQLINVFLGDMSLVGPRPLSLADLENISERNTMSGYYTLRGNIRPGMTGLWQISGRREVSFREMVLLDLYYIENQSLLFDLEIIFDTIPVVIFGRGAY